MWEDILAVAIGVFLGLLFYNIVAGLFGGGE